MLLRKRARYWRGSSASTAAAARRTKRLERSRRRDFDSGKGALSSKAAGPAVRKGELPAITPTTQNGSVLYHPELYPEAAPRLNAGQECVKFGNLRQMHYLYNPQSQRDVG